MNFYDFELEMLSAGVDTGLHGVDDPEPLHGCVPPDVWNPTLARCMPPCLPPALIDPTTGLCVQCAPGGTWDAGRQTCTFPDGPDAPALPGGFVAPGAVKVRPANWQLEEQPYAKYKLAWGDTYVGLAATYLGEGARWREIWDLNRAMHPSPDKIFVTQVINMPDEAREKMKRWLRGPKEPGSLPGELPKEPTSTEKLRSWAPWIIGGALIAYVGYTAVNEKG